MLDYKYNNLHLIVNYILFCMLNYNNKHKWRQVVSPNATHWVRTSRETIHRIVPLGTVLVSSFILKIL